MPNIDIWSQNLSNEMKQVEKKRAEDFQQAFAGLPDLNLLINTGKVEKALGLLELIQHYIGVPIILHEGAFLFESDQEEITAEKATEVAKWKAEQILLSHRDSQGSREIIAAGADVNAFTKFGKKEEQSHKLSRLPTQLLRVRQESIINELITNYSQPESGIVSVRWDLGSHFKNGTSHTFGDEIRIEADPIERELMEESITDAVDNGLFTKSNHRFGAIETLRRSGKIRSVSILPDSMKQQGYTLDDVQQSPTEDLLDRAQRSIVMNVPPQYN